MGFPRQKYWCRRPFPPLGDVLDPGIKPRSPALQQSPALQACSLLTEPLGKHLKPCDFLNDGVRGVSLILIFALLTPNVRVSKSLGISGSDKSVCLYANEMTGSWGP